MKVYDIDGLRRLMLVEKKIKAGVLKLSSIWMSRRFQI